jgi:hypothetical protein
MDLCSVQIVRRGCLDRTRGARPKGRPPRAAAARTRLDAARRPLLLKAGLGRVAIKELEAKSVQWSREERRLREPGTWPQRHRATRCATSGSWARALRNASVR